MASTVARPATRVLPDLRTGRCFRCCCRLREVLLEEWVEHGRGGGSAEAPRRPMVHLRFFVANGLVFLVVVADRDVGGRDCRYCPGVELTYMKGGGGWYEMLSVVEPHVDPSIKVHGICHTNQTHTSHSLTVSLPHLLPLTCPTGFRCGRPLPACWRCSRRRRRRRCCWYRRRRRCYWCRRRRRCCCCCCCCCC